MHEPCKRVSFSFVSVTSCHWHFSEAPRNLVKTKSQLDAALKHYDVCGSCSWGLRERWIGRMILTHKFNFFPSNSNTFKAVNVCLTWNGPKLHSIFHPCTVPHLKSPESLVVQLRRWIISWKSWAAGSDLRCLWQMLLTVEIFSLPFWTHFSGLLSVTGNVEGTPSSPSFLPPAPPSQIPLNVLNTYSGYVRLARSLALSPVTVT